MLESDPEAMTAGNFTFQTDKLIFSPNARLVAPNTPEIARALEKILQTFGEQLHGTKAVSITAQTLGRQPTFLITPQTCPSLKNLIGNLAP